MNGPRVRIGPHDASSAGAECLAHRTKVNFARTRRESREGAGAIREVSPDRVSPQAVEPVFFPPRTQTAKPPGRPAIVPVTDLV